MKLSDLDFLKLLPIFMRDDEAVQALADVVNVYTRRVDKKLPLVRKWDQIDNMGHEKLDELAWELNVLWYDKGSPLETKRRLIKNSDMVYARLGTTWAVEEIVSTYFGSAEVLEWFEYGGRPHYFKIICGDPYITQEEEQRFLHALNIVKRKSQWLEAIIIQLASKAGFFVGSLAREGETSRHVLGSGKMYRLFGVAINDAAVEAVTILPAVSGTVLSSPALYYAALALWCKKNGYFPSGNNYYGKDVAKPYETGTVSYAYESYGKTYDGRVYTGSGPVAWRHDGTASGIDSLNGNVWEWSAGLRLVDGEIQVIPDNNAAAAIDQSLNSGLWKAIMPAGTLVTPGTNGTLKFDYLTTPAVGGKFQLATNLTNKQTTEDPYGSQSLETTAAKSGVVVPEILKALAVMPADAESHGGDVLWMCNLGERLPIRGGNWRNAAYAGVFALDLIGPRTSSGYNIGFRSAFVKI